MPWQIPVILDVLVSYGLLQLMIKKIAATDPTTTKLVWQYAFSAGAAIIAALILNVDLWQKGMLIVMAIGVFNAFACFCHWKAYAISMSRTSLFTQADDLIALALGYIFLGEIKIVGGILAAGLVLSVGSGFLFIFSHPEKAKKEEIGNAETGKGSVGRKGSLTMWVILYSLIWGVVPFSMRYFSLQGMSVFSYLIACYLGSFVGAILTFLFAGKKMRGKPLSKIQIGSLSVLAVVLWICFGLHYWCRSVVPITVSQPIFQVAEMVLPTFIGLWIFKEIKHLDRVGWIAILLGLGGGVTIALSY